MHRFLALILAMVLCFSVCACGGQHSDDNPSLQGENNSTSAPSFDDTFPTLDPVLPTEGSNNNSQDNKVLPVIGATKLMSMRQRDDRPLTIELHADYTCTIGDKTYTWTQSYDNYDRPLVSVTDGTEELYRMNFGDMSGNVDVYQGDNYFIYLDLSVYERIELTAENWDTYFEVVKTFDIFKNAFGDFDLAEYEIWYCLKEPYYERLYNKDGSPAYYQDSVAVEVEISEQHVNYAIDVQNGTYTVEPYGSVDLNKKVCTSSQGQDYFHLFIDDALFYNETGNWPYPVEFSLLRATGYLWLKQQ